MRRRKTWRHKSVTIGGNMKKIKIQEGSVRFWIKRFIYIFSGFLLLFIFSGCASTRNKTHIVEVSAGKTMFTFVSDQPDRSMVNLPQSISKLRFSNPDEFIRQLAAHAAKSSTNNFELVKKVHDWIALNIKYDAESFLSRNVPAQNYENTLMSGLAVCDGYSALFKRICDELEIECLRVSGYARGVGSTIFLPDFIWNSNHAWNMVKLDNDWYLIDCTWDAGYLDGTQAVQSYKTEYLFIKPEIMIYTHFPDDPEYQLLDPPVTAAEFVDSPRYTASYFKYMAEVPSNLKKVTEIGGRIKVNFLTKDGAYLMVNVLDMGGRELPNGNRISRLWKNGNAYECDFTFPQEGFYILRFYANNERYGTYEWIADYGISTSGYVPTSQEEAMRAVNDSFRFGNTDVSNNNTPQREGDFTRELMDR